MYNVWCDDLKEIIEEPECDKECGCCEDCVEILSDGKQRKVTDED